MSHKKIIFGLGNPGSKYENNRHNIGVKVVQLLAKKFDSEFKKAINGSVMLSKKNLTLPPNIHTDKDQNFECELILSYSQSFMNLSGAPVSKVLSFYEVKLSDLLVIHDQIDMKFSTMKLKRGGGHHGHNGLRDIINVSGADFDRLCFGISRPPHKDHVADYVLNDFTKHEELDLPSLLEKACELCIDWVNGTIAI